MKTCQCFALFFSLPLPTSVFSTLARSLVTKHNIHICIQSAYIITYHMTVWTVLYIVRRHTHTDNTNGLLILALSSSYMDNPHRCMHIIVLWHFEISFQFGLLPTISMTFRFTFSWRLLSPMIRMQDSTSRACKQVIWRVRACVRACAFVIHPVGY